MAQDPDSRTTIRRRWLTIFFVVHWWAVATYVLPATREAMAPLPDWLEPAFAAVTPRAVRWTSPLTVPYWNLSATRQHWTLFAPDPAGWNQTLQVVPYFPVGDGVWVADTLTFRGPLEQSHPHVLNHRTHRLFYNMGYERWGEAYRVHFAREMCRTLRDQDGVAPEGLEFFAKWFPEWAPWEEPWFDEEVYHQRLGGWDCADEDGARRGVQWWAYGLPDPVDTGGWPSVRWSSPQSGSELPDPGPPPGADATAAPADSVPKTDEEIVHGW